MSGGGTIYEYQRELTAKLEQVMRERDELRAEVERLRDVVESLESDFTRRQAAHRCATWDDGQGTCECNDLARTVAERQREACASVLEGQIAEWQEAGTYVDAVRATPLVTEGDK